MPLGETDLHIHWIIRIRDILKNRVRDQRTYVAADLLVYYEEGDPSRFVVPDAMVVKDCDPGRRRIFKIWEEGRTPSAVIETTSRGTKREDAEFKPRIYERLNVGEYFLYDPSAEYLRPPLQGYRLISGGYQQIAPDASGRILSQELGLSLHLEDGDLVLTDVQSGERLLTDAEAERAAAEAQRAAAEAQRAAADTERAARLAAEAEVEQLRETLRRHGLAD
jgi:hypothetical protein